MTIYYYYYALIVEYNGKDYCGWQKQKHCPTIQETLEKVLSKISNQSIHTVCAGRTDSGVHATGQVISFKTNTNRPLKAWILGANALLPADIKVVTAYFVEKNFNARLSAEYRRYNYLIYQRKISSAFFSSSSAWLPYVLDLDIMNEASQYLLGEQDFSAFRSSECQSRSTYRNIHHAFFKKNGDYIVFDIKANSFLHHMVRNIVGTLVEVGVGRKKAAWVANLLRKENNDKIGKKMPSKGLYLVDVGYPNMCKFINNTLII